MTDSIDIIERMFAFNLWANSELIARCASLGEQQLAVEAVGVFGRIQPTLVHTIRAEGIYIKRLSGKQIWDKDLDWDTLSISELLPLAQLSGETLVAIASKADASARHDVEVNGQPFYFFNWTVLLQAFYHGVEHRTQLKILLTKLGIEHGDMSVWDFTDAITGQ